MRFSLGVALALAAASCGDGNQQTSDDAGSGGGDAAMGNKNDGGKNPIPDMTMRGDGPAPPAATCAAPLMPVDTSKPTTVVGKGMPADCTEKALADAIAAGGIITFNCGGKVTIPITTEKVLPTNKGAITIDGGNNVTFDGGGMTRLFSWNTMNFRATNTVITFQHVTFTNAKSSGTMMFPVLQNNPDGCSQGWQDGGGGAIYIRDGVLHLIDDDFENNASAYPGPDVAGGGVYAVGCNQIVVYNSRFTGNTGSNGGAIGSLFSNLTVVNTVFTQNAALGTGANSTNNTCPNIDGQRETGSGGNGGAISIDGGETNKDGSPTVVMCGNLFSQNMGNAFGGAIFRTPDITKEPTTISQSVFDGNKTKSGGALYFHNSTLSISDSALVNNTAEGAGAIFADGTTFQFTNVTLANNSATTDPGGTINLFGDGGTEGTLTNCTFANNKCLGKPGSGFAAAIFGGTTFKVFNTIFDNQSSMDANAPMTCQSVNDGTNDLQWPKTHSVGNSDDQLCANNITIADPLLGMLMDNGGPSPTLLPGMGSPAIGAGVNCPDHDQRLQPRNTAKCTLGAAEVN